MDLDLIPHMVFARHLIDAAFGRSVRNQHPGLREGAWRPDIEKRAATARSHPEARILPVPAAIQVGSGGVRVVVNTGAAAIEIRSAVAAQKAHVVHQRVATGHPLHPDGAWIDAVGIDTDPDHDVGAALGRFDHGLGTADALKGPVRSSRSIWVAL